MSEELKKQSSYKDEVDLIDLALKIWAERKLIYKTIAVFFVLGLIVAFGSKKEYKAEMSFILEDNSGGSRVSGLMAQFGGLAGINLGGVEEGTISPDLYPNIIKSKEFLLEIINTPLFIKKIDSSLSPLIWISTIEKPSLIGYIKKYTLHLPGTILSTFKNKDSEANPVKIDRITEVKTISPKEESVINYIKDKINISLDEKTGIIKLETELPDQIAAAELTNVIYKKLTEYLINFKIEKASKDYQFFENQHKKAQINYEKSQEELATFRDNNLNVSSAYYKTEEERLQNNYNLYFSVYNSLSQQLEQKKIELQEAMPMFKPVNSIFKPLHPSKPNKALILIVFSFMGITLSMLRIIIKIQRAKH